MKKLYFIIIFAKLTEIYRKQLCQNKPWYVLLYCIIFQWAGLLFEKFLEFWQRNSAVFICIQFGHERRCLGLVHLAAPQHAELPHGDVSAVVSVHRLQVSDSISAKYEGEMLIQLYYYITIFVVEVPVTRVIEVKH